MKPFSYKRIAAYLLDLLIVYVISMLLVWFIPMGEEYNKRSDDYTNVILKYSSGEITSDKYIEDSKDISYDVNKLGVSISIIMLAVTTIYFVVVQYYNNGQTIGKKIMKLKIEPYSDKKLTMNNFLIHSVIVNSILLNLISIVMIVFVSKDVYLNIYDYISYIFTGLNIIILVMILYRKDGRGLHDILANTKVISLDTNTIKQEEVVKEALVVEEQ